MTSVKATQCTARANGFGSVARRLLAPETISVPVSF
jgi:hypothetical protein